MSEPIVFPEKDGSFNDDLSAFLAENYEFDYKGGSVTKVGPDHDTGWRSLPFTVMVHLVGGGARIHSEGGYAAFCGDGEGLCLPPGVPHRIEMEGVVMVSRWSHVNMTFLGTIDLSAVYDLPILLPKDIAAAGGDLSEELEKISRRTPSLTKTLRLQAKGRELAALLIDYGRIRSGSRRFIESIDRLSPLLKHLRRNSAQTVSTQEMAQMVHLSVPRFHVVFKQTLGISPGQFLQNLRMRRAQQLLLTSDIPITDIAAQTGYDDPFHFSRLFTQLFGTSPTKYRAIVRAKLYESSEESAMPLS